MQNRLAVYQRNNNRNEMQTALNVGLRKSRALNKSAKSLVRGMVTLNTIRQLRALEILRNSWPTWRMSIP